MIQVKSEREALREGLSILIREMEPSTFARFCIACNLGAGDYLELKDELFVGESVASLYAKVLEFQEAKRES
jgi:hypothetical protein